MSERIVDRGLATEILHGFDGNAEDLTGKTSLNGLIEQLLTFRVLLTNDTGTMHLADYLGVPLVAVFGSTEPHLTGPRSPKSVVLATSGRMQPVFSPRMSAGLSLHARGRPGGGCKCDPGAHRVPPRADFGSIIKLEPNGRWAGGSPFGEGVEHLALPLTDMT